MFELLLVSVIVVTIYLGQQLYRGGGPARRPYALMLLGDGALALISVGANHSAGGGTRTTDLLGAIALGGFVCLVMVPPMLRDLTRRALAGDRISLALRLLELRELLQPGMGARQDRDMLATDAAVRSGHVDEALAVLRARRGATQDPMQRRMLDERIVFSLLYARRWRQALDHFERTIEAQPGPVTPPLLVEVVRAYCEEGDLAKAASLMDRLERSPIAQEPMLAILLARARMVFLAFVGRAADVEALLAPAGILGVMPPAVRAYWIGVARLHGGDRDGARAALTEAMTMAGRDARAKQIAEDLLAKLIVNEPPPEPTDAASAPPPPTGLIAPELPAQVAELADRVALSSREKPAAFTSDRPQIPRLEGVRAREVPVTFGLIVANVIVAGLVAWLLGSSESQAVLVAAGANLKLAVRAGEWWRLDASTFLHVGFLHLALNMYGLWVLGRLVEQLIGPARLFAVYSLAGIGGAIASVLFGGEGISAGASGAVLGLLGAATAELWLHGKEYPERWRRALLGNLLFIMIAQLVIGGAYPAIDQAAHVGGLVVGAAAATVLAPRGRFGKSMAARALTAILCVASVASIGWSVYGVMTTSYADTLQRVPWVRHHVDGVSYEAPNLWVKPDKVDGKSDAPESALVDPTFELTRTLTVDVLDLPATGDDAHAPPIDRPSAAKKEGEPSVEDASPTFQLPGDEWVSKEQTLHFDKPRDRVYRTAVFVRAAGDRAVRLELVVPERDHKAMAPIVDRLLTSVHVDE
jgi:membrane associated rhomboid family serine protease